LLGAMRWTDQSLSLLADPGSELAPGKAFGWLGPVVRYSTVTPGTHVELEAAGPGFSGRIVIGKRPQAAVRFGFRLGLSGLQPAVDEHGAPQLVDGSGAVAAKVTAGRLAGAENDQLTRSPIRTGAASVSIESLPGGDASLRIVPDARFLSDPGVVYPVTLEFGVSSTSRSTSKAGPTKGGGSVVSALSGCTDDGFCAPPEQPGGLQATAFNEKIDATWSAPSGSTGVDGYTAKVHRAGDGAVVATQNVAPAFSPQAAFTFRDGIVNGERYYVEVFAYNSAGAGPSVTSATVAPAAAPWSLFDLLGTSNPSQPTVTCRSSWGVTCANGNFAWSRTYLRIPGRGVPLGFTLTFNAHALYRWTHNYLMRVDWDSSSMRRVVQENGSTAYFFDDGAGGWHAAGGTQATLTRDASGNYVFKRLHDLTSFGFDAGGLLLWQADRNGYRTTITYDSVWPGKPARATDPAGRYLSFDYDSRGRLSTVTDTTGRRVTLGYPAYPASYWQVPSSLSDPAGGVTGFAYEGDYLLNMIRSPKATATGSGQVTTVAYDGSQLATVGDPTTARKMTYSYTNSEAAPGTASTNTTTITDPLGSVVVARHTNQQVTSLTLGNGADQVTTTATIDPRTMKPASITDARGAVWRQTLDAHGNVLSATDPLNRTTTYTYNAQDRPLTRTDPLNITDTDTYDANGNLLTASRPLTGTSTVQRTTYGYDPARPGDLTSITDPTGQVWRYAYNANGDQTSSTDPLGNTATATYDPVGRRLTATTPRGNATGAIASQYTTSYAWSALGDLLSLTDPLNGRTTYDYDANRNRIAATDRNLNKTTYVYNVFDQLTTIKRPDGKTLKNGYDNNSHVVSQTDGGGNTTTYGYDSLNRLTSRTDPLSRQQTYGYNANGQHTRTTDATGRTTTRSYDLAGQLTAISYSDGATAGVTYGYDGDGRRVSMTDGSGQSTYSYDSLHRLVSHRDGAAQTVGFGWDLADRQTAITYPPSLGGGGGTVTRGYDAAGRMTSVRDWLNRTTTFGYDRDSNRISQTYPNGVSTARGFDSAGRLTSVVASAPTASQFLNLPYVLDAGGRMSSEAAVNFGYDRNDRLTGGAGISYRYSTADNLTSAEFNTGETHTLTYDAASQLRSLTTFDYSGTSEDGGTGLPRTITDTYGYDANGNRTTVNSQTAYAYDQASRLKSAAGATYVYDGDGLRAKKTTSAGTSVHTWDITRGLPEMIGDAGTAYITGPDGMPLAQITTAGTTHYYHQDRLGSTRALTTSTGALAATYTYGPYGTLTSQTGNLTTPFGYAGQYTDTETGFQYLRARYYDPRTYNFLTRDPISAVTRAPYNYADNNPTNKTDPTGLGGEATGTAGGANLPILQLPPWAAPAAAGLGGLGLGIGIGLGIDWATPDDPAGCADDDGPCGDDATRPPIDRDALSNAGRAPVRGGRTAAGRAYQKHMDRGELPHVPGKSLDEAGQSLLDDILTDPGSTIQPVSSGNAAGGTRIIRPDGQGVTFNPDGSLAYFGHYRS
jgi:RHS repeat-associated protein